MNYKKRRKLTNHGMRMIESVMSPSEEFAMEFRIKDQLYFNLGEQYYRKTQIHKKKYK